MTFNEDGTVPYIDETSTGLTGTASVISATGQQIYIATAFNNPSDDASYPLKKPLTATADGADLKTTQWEIEQGKLDSSNESTFQFNPFINLDYISVVKGKKIILTGKQNRHRFSKKNDI